MDTEARPATRCSSPLESTTKPTVSSARSRSQKATQHIASALATLTLASGSGSSVGLGVNSVGGSKNAANPEAVAAIKPAAAQASISIQTEAAAKSVRGGAREQQLLDMLLAEL